MYGFHAEVSWIQMHTKQVNDYLFVNCYENDISFSFNFKIKQYFVVVYYINYLKNNILRL